MVVGVSYDDDLDKVDLLRSFESRGDHGVHAVVPTPDGKYLFFSSKRKGEGDIYWVDARVIDTLRDSPDS